MKRGERIITGRMTERVSVWLGRPPSADRYQADAGSSPGRSRPSNLSADSFVFTEDEKPPFAGAPFTPPQPFGRRIAYGAVSVCFALLSTFQNALLSDNLTEAAGEYGLTEADAVWLVAVFVGFGTFANFFVIKGRQQFGLGAMVIASLAANALAAALGLLSPNLAIAFVERCLNGLTASTGVATSIYYLIQSLPRSRRPAAVVLVISLVQIATPLARLVPVDLVTDHGNSGLRLIGFAIPVALLAMVLLFPLPPSFRIAAFRRADVLTMAAVLPACVMLSGVLSLGRVRPRPDTPWLGGLLAGGIVFAALAILHEMQRRHPLFSTSGLNKVEIARFILVAMSARIMSAEQGSGAVALLSSFGLDNDQYHTLFSVVVVSMVAATVLLAVLVGPKTIPLLIGVALLCISAGSWLDAGSNASTRPDQMLLSQAAVGCGIILFTGPALLFSVGKALKSHGEAFITLIILFASVQYVGSAAGSALIGTVQYVYERVATVILFGDLGASVSTMPTSQVAGQATQQSSVIGYLDAIRLVAVLSGAAGLLVLAAAAIAATRSIAPRHA